MSFYKVLLIDDDPISNFVTAMTIQHVELAEKVEVCHSGFEGLQYLISALAGNKIFPDLIFLDINMPGMNGWQFLAEYRKFPKKVKKKIRIVILTSSCYIEDEIKAKDYAEVFEYCAKPLTNESLMALRELVESTPYLMIA